MNSADTQPRRNELGQPVGEPIGAWQAPPRPPWQTLNGRWCRIEALDPAVHAGELYRAVCEDVDGHNWTYLAYGPFADEAAYRQWVESVSGRDDPMFFAIRETLGGATIGVASFLRIEPTSGCIEVGHIHFSPRLQQTPVATEAMYLMMKQVFDLGYRRYEWKCDSCNEPSRRAAQRFGFSYEGIFRQATLYKGRNRDTAWYAMTDRDWPAVAQAYQRWLAGENFDDSGRQRESLSALTRPLLKNA